jgi:uncharacterized protein
MIHETIKAQIKEAMLAKDSVRLTTLRGLLSSFTNELVAKKRKPQELLTDEEAMDVILRNVKQRKDSIEQFKAGGRNDLAETEEAELKILDTYLPTQMTDEEIEATVKSKMAELGITDKAKSGMLTGMIMKDLKGKADGQKVKQTVENLLS